RLEQPVQPLAREVGHLARAAPLALVRVAAVALAGQQRGELLRPLDREARARQADLAGAHVALEEPAPLLEPPHGRAPSSDRSLSSGVSVSEQSSASAASNGAFSSAPCFRSPWISGSFSSTRSSCGSLPRRYAPISIRSRWSS